MVRYRSKLFVAPPPLPITRPPMPVTTPPPMPKTTMPSTSTPPTMPKTDTGKGKSFLGKLGLGDKSGKFLGKVGEGALFVGLPALGMIQTHKAMKESKEQNDENLSAMKEQTKAINERTKEIKRQADAESDEESGKLKTKKFAWPLIASLAMGGAQMAQSAQQGKEAEKMNKQQLKAQAKATKATEKQNQLLEEIKNKDDMSAQEKQAKATMLLQKTESEPSSVLEKTFAAMNWNSAKLVGRDLFRAAKTAGVGSTMKSNAKTALGMAGAAYVVNKAIQHDMKKNNIDVDKSGNLVQKGQKSYSIKDKLKRAAGPGIGAAMSFSFEAPRYLSYQAEKKQLKGQIAATGPNNPNLNSGQTSIMAQQKPLVPRQKQFGRFQLNRQGWNTFNAHRGRSISGMGVQLTSFGLGTENVQKFGSSLAGSKNNFLKKTGTWIGKHPTKANVAALVPAAAIGALSFNKVMSAGKKGLEKVDPDAYKYQNAKDSAVGGQNS